VITLSATAEKVHGPIGILSAVGELCDNHCNQSNAMSERSTEAICVCVT